LATSTPTRATCGRARKPGGGRRDAIDHAIQLLRNGIALVGDNARLYVAMGHAWLQYREAGIDATDAPVAEAEACASKVFALEPASDLAFQLGGWIHYCRGRIVDAHEVRRVSPRGQGNDPGADCRLPGACGRQAERGGRRSARHRSRGHGRRRVSPDALEVGYRVGSNS
jgi:hypothetical protein